MADPARTEITQTSLLPESTEAIKALTSRAQSLTMPFDPKTGAAIQKTYQPYTGEQFAQFTPLQQQAFAGAETMQPSEWLNRSAGLATQFVGDEAYSPYIQNVINTEKREAARQSAIQGLQGRGQATAQGAYGGSRSAIVEAERQRNLAEQMGDIQTRGLQAAYDRQQQAAMQAAQQLGALGQTGFQQQMDINKLQGAYGGAQQQQLQNMLTRGYEQFIEEQQQPYKDLAFMADILRGTPSTGISARSVYEAPPSMAQQLIGGGLGLASMYNLFTSPSSNTRGGLGSFFGAEGGEVYAEGGDVYDGGGYVGANSSGHFGDEDDSSYAIGGPSYGLGGVALNQLYRGAIQ